MSDLSYELEQAMVSLTKAGIGAEANVYGGKNSGDKQLPCVICEAAGEGEEDPKSSGNYWFRIQWRIRATSATEEAGPDPTLADTQLVADVSALFRVTDLDAGLNAQGRILTVLGFVLESPIREENELGGWDDILSARVYCCNSVLAP